MRLVIINICFGLLISSSTLVAQEDDNKDVLLENQYVIVNVVEKDLGIVLQHRKTVFKFRLKNINDEPLVIWHVTASCGCTSPSWTNKPVKKGSKAVVKVEYNALEIGEFNKSVYVYTKFSDKPIKLSILGAVVAQKSDAEVSKRETNFNSKLPN